MRNSFSCGSLLHCIFQSINPTGIWSLRYFHPTKLKRWCSWDERCQNVWNCSMKFLPLIKIGHFVEHSIISISFFSQNLILKNKVLLLWGIDSFIIKLRTSVTRYKFRKYEMCNWVSSWRAEGVHHRQIISIKILIRYLKTLLTVCCVYINCLPSLHRWLIDREKYLLKTPVRFYEYTQTAYGTYKITADAILII